MLSALSSLTISIMNLTSPQPSNTDTQKWICKNISLDFGNHSLRQEFSQKWIGNSGCFSNFTKAIYKPADTQVQITGSSPKFHWCMRNKFWEICGLSTHPIHLFLSVETCKKSTWETCSQTTNHFFPFLFCL